MKFRLMAGLVFLLMGMGGCAPNPPSLSGPQGLIVPHHALVEHEIIAFLEEVATERDPATVEQVIVLSPNHFGYGYHNLQTTDQAFQASNGLWPLDIDILQELVNKTSLAFEPEKFSLEHGITVPWALLTEAFPSAKLVPITLKPETPQHELDQLVESLGALDFTQTLVVASVDFSHLTPEEIAVKNDEATVAWLATVSMNEEGGYDALQSLAHPDNLADYEGAVAIDSPESLYVLTRLMQNKGATAFTLWKRTSSASLTGIQDPTQNTSHVFGWFTSPSL